MVLLILLLVSFFVPFMLKLYLIMCSSQRGSDSYYFLLCTEELKKKKKVPIVLPHYYLLEHQEQWYPPGFTILLSLLPEKFLKKHHGLISPIIDSLIAVVITGVTYYLTHDVVVSFVAGLFYSLSISSIEETVSLTSRPLGALFLSATVFSAIFFSETYDIIYLCSFFICGYLLLMSHKLGSQAFYVLLPSLSLVLVDSLYIILFFSLLAFTFIFTKGFYYKVLLAHYDIVSFWGRNNKNLLCHPVYDSSVYVHNKPLGFKSKRYHNLGFWAKIKPVIYMFAKCPALLCSIFAIIILSKGGVVVFPYSIKLFYWAVIIGIFALMTIWLPFLRSLGEGDKYFKFIASPVSCIALLPFVILDRSNPVYLGYFSLTVVSLVLSLIAYYFFRQKYKKNVELLPDIISDDMDKVIAYVNELVSPRIMCFPTTINDVLAYHCRVTVLWGTHGYGFKNVENFFPKLKKPVMYFVEKYNLTHMILDTDYVKAEAFDLQFKSKKKFGTLYVCEF